MSNLMDEPKRFYLMIEKDQLPICNQNSGARHLSVDEILERTERSVEPPDFGGSSRPYKRSVPWLAILILVAFGIGVIWFLFR